jgi:D,D-heptose 1,7-bisphosphate phosphatase
VQAVILIGGAGTRLGTLVKDLPKPLLPVAGRPFVEHLLYVLSRHGIRDVVLLAGYRAEAVERSYGAGSGAAARLGVEITVVTEPSALGTAGALTHARHLLDDEFLLLNGDSLFDFNVLDLPLPAAAGSARTLLTMALRFVPDARRYGVVEQTDGHVTAFREKSRTAGAGLVNGGVYWVSRSVLDLIKRTPCSLEQEILPSLVAAGRVSAKVYDGYFVDIGIPEDFARAQHELPTVFVRPSVFFDRDDTLIHDRGYTYRVEDLRWISGVPQMIKRLNDARVLVFVITNQAGVAKGHFEEASIAKFHRHMNNELALRGAHVDDWRYCPHHESGTVPRYTKACTWRKPSPGMILDLIEHWPVDRARSLVLGNNDTDVAAGRNANLESRRVNPGDVPEAIDIYLRSGAFSEPGKT